MPVLLCPCCTSSASSSASSTPSASPRTASSNSVPNLGRNSCSGAIVTRNSRQLPPSRPQLAAPAPHLLQGRTHRRRNQPALRDYQLLRSCLGGLRFLQRSRR